MSTLKSRALRVMDADERYITLCRYYGEAVRMVPRDDGLYVPDCSGRHARMLELRALKDMQYGQER